jgi:polar amino acid transport system permease protein
VTYQWSFGFLWEYRTLIATGLLITVLFTVGTNIAGLVLGLLVGLARLLMPKVVQLPLIAYVELFRCTPLLVQLIWIYYALPVLIGVNIPAYTAGALALSLYAGSFYAEIFRGGVSSIDRGQWDAARAIGMRQGQALRRIILPQAFRLTTPPIINQSVLQLKNTSLISTLAVGDLLYQGSIITAATYRPLEVYTMVAVLYFAVLFPMTLLARRIEVRLGRGHQA